MQGVNFSSSRRRNYGQQPVQVTPQNGGMLPPSAPMPMPVGQGVPQGGAGPSMQQAMSQFQGGGQSSIPQLQNQFSQYAGGMRQAQNQGANRPLSPLQQQFGPIAGGPMPMPSVQGLQQAQAGLQDRFGASPGQPSLQQIHQQFGGGMGGGQQAQNPGMQAYQSNLQAMLGGGRQLQQPPGAKGGGIQGKGGPGGKGGSKDPSFGGPNPMQPSVMPYPPAYGGGQ